MEGARKLVRRHTTFSRKAFRMERHHVGSDAAVRAIACYVAPATRNSLGPLICVD
jgi:hypothetical protein